MGLWPAANVTTVSIKSSKHFDLRCTPNDQVKQRANHMSIERSEHPWIARLLQRSLGGRRTGAYRRVSVTRANGLRTPELSLSMCHCQESFDGS